MLKISKFQLILYNLHKAQSPSKVKFPEKSSIRVVTYKFVIVQEKSAQINTNDYFYFEQTATSIHNISSLVVFVFLVLEFVSILGIWR